MFGRLFKTLRGLREQLPPAQAAHPSQPLAASMSGAPPWNPQSDFIPGDALNLGTLVGLFRRVMIPFEQEEDSLYLDIDGCQVRVFLDADRGLVVMRSGWRFRREASRDERLELVNRLNDSVILVRYADAGDDRLLADYALFYAGGIPAFMLVNSVRRFARISLMALREHDAANIVA